MSPAQLAAATGEGIKSSGSPDKSNFTELVSNAVELNGVDQEYDEERRSIFVDKFEDIGMLDPNGQAAAPASKTKPAGKSPNKKGGKDGGVKNRHLRKLFSRKICILNSK